MTTEQMRGLDAWIDLNVFGNQPAYAVMKNGAYYRPQARGYTDDIHKAWATTLETASSELVEGEDMKVVPIPPKAYTTDPTASDALDDKILEKLKGRGYATYFRGGEFWMSTYTGETISVTHADKKICRALFAKSLFSNPKQEWK